MKFNEKLNLVDWNETLTDARDVNVCYDAFADKLLEIHNSCFPLTRISRKAYKNKSWYNPTLRSMLYEKNRLYRNWISTFFAIYRVIYLYRQKLRSSFCINDFFHITWI